MTNICHFFVKMRYRSVLLSGNVLITVERIVKYGNDSDDIYIDWWSRDSSC